MPPTWLSIVDGPDSTIIGTLWYKTMKQRLFASILAGSCLAVPMSASALYVDIPGVVRICDDCGGGLLGGTRSNIPWSAVDFLLDVAQSSGDPLLLLAAHNLDQFKKTVTEEAQTAINNALKASSASASDAAKNFIKSANDIVDATNAIARYAEREVSGTVDVFTVAQQRIRDGKVVDAIWHISTDTWQHASKNAAQLAEENEIFAVAGQAAATAYGGPTGAAAYAAWRTYNQSGGNVDLSLKAGVYAYVTASGSLKAGNMPTDSVLKVANKAAVTGAMGGLAVAASGGSNEDALKAFIDSGSAVVVQAGQSYVSKNYSDTQPPRFDNYCVTAVNAPCAKARDWYDSAKKRVDDLKTISSSTPTIGVTRNGDWAISWDKNAATHPAKNTPAVALTYVGEGSPFNNVLREAAAIGDPQKFSGYWVAFRRPGAAGAYFDFTSPEGSPATPTIGTNLRANTNINMRFSPGDLTTSNGVLPSGTDVKVLELKTLRAAGVQQEWIRLQLPSPTLGTPKTLTQLLDAIEKSNDPVKTKKLKLKARSLITPNLAFTPITHSGAGDLYRFSETLSFVEYDPKSNILIVRRQRRGDGRGDTAAAWKPVEALDARLHIEAGKLNSLATKEDGAFEVYCLTEGGSDKCVTNEILSEKCNELTSMCQPQADWYVRFSEGDNPTGITQLKSGLTTIIYKINK